MIAHSVTRFAAGFVFYLFIYYFVSFNSEDLEICWVSDFPSWVSNVIVGDLLSPLPPNKEI